MLLNLYEEKFAQRHYIQRGVSCQEFFSRRGDASVAAQNGRFDLMAAGVVRAAKVRHPEVTLTLLLPYYPFDHDTSDYDSTYYPEGLETVPKPFAIVRANEHMIQTADYLICYDAGLVGNTGKLVKKALRRQAKGEMRVENLAERLAAVK